MANLRAIDGELDDAELERALAGPGPVKVHAATRYEVRARRKRLVRAKTVSVQRMTKRELEMGRIMFPEIAEWRPRTRADCAAVARPCPYVACVHHLYLDVSARTGAIKLNFPDVAVDELEKLPATCALDVAEAGGTTLEGVGDIMNLTRERIRQLEVRAIAKVVRAGGHVLKDYAAEGPIGRRRLPILTEEDEES